MATSDKSIVTRAVKLHILSDIHLEFGKWPRNVDVNAIDADVTILAGDIGVGLQGLQWALTIDRPVVYVMGNHELYGQRPMQYLWRKARQKVAGTHIHLLENESILIADPRNPGEVVRFLGATLWTDFSALGSQLKEQCMEHVARSMTDYHVIFVTRRNKAIAEPGFTARHQGDRLTPLNTLSFHNESRDFLERELARSSESVGAAKSWSKTVVVTHHAPSAGSLTYRQATTYSDAAYASHLDHLVAKADLWVHGHTHISNDYQVGERGIGRVVCNPRGYVGHELVSDFEPTFVIEV